MDEQPPGRFSIVIVQGPPRGDLFELEQKTTYQVIDNTTGEMIMIFEGLMEASLSTSTGLWDDYQFSGVRQVTISPDEQSIAVTYFDGREYVVPLPQST